MALAKIVNLASDTDKTVILNVRAGVRQKIQAPDWLDLRIGFLLSATASDNDDDTADLEETIDANGGLLGPEDRYWIGLKDGSELMPDTPHSVFIGYTNRGGLNRGPRTPYDSVLVSSDEALGTTNANFWRLASGDDRHNYWSGGIIDSSIVRGRPHDGIQQHFVQDAVGAGGYATLLMLRLTRPDTDSNANKVTVTTKQGTHNGDVLYTDTPTTELLLANMEDFPGTVQQWGPVQLSQVPDTLFLFWPFRGSRLRIHAMGILKAR